MLHIFPCLIFMRNWLLVKSSHTHTYLLGKKVVVCFWNCWFVCLFVCLSACLFVCLLATLFKKLRTGCSEILWRATLSDLKIWQRPWSWERKYCSWSKCYGFKFWLGRTKGMVPFCLSQKIIVNISLCIQLIVSLLSTSLRSQDDNVRGRCSEPYLICPCCATYYKSCTTKHEANLVLWTSYLRPQGRWWHAQM